MKVSAVVAVVGRKGSGKTTAIEVLVKGLVERGYRVSVVKHIPKRGFTIDAEGKDTWRFAKSGAKMIVSVSPNEVAVIEKLNTATLSLEDILRRCGDSDVILIEGLRGLVGVNLNVLKIVAVKSADEALEALKEFRPIIAFTGPYVTDNLNLSIPYVDVMKDRERIVDVVEGAIKGAVNGCGVWRSSMGGGEGLKNRASKPFHLTPLKPIPHPSKRFKGLEPAFVKRYKVRRNTRFPFLKHLSKIVHFQHPWLS